MSKIYIVASLPRTGTTSLCEMAKIVGLSAIHNTMEDFPRHLKEGANFFADTPFYDTGYLIALFQHHENISVIYSMRDLDSLEKSWDRFGIHYYLTRFPIKTASNIHDIVSIACVRKIQVESLRQDHYITVKKLCEQYHVPFLEYSFDMGWEPFCKFTRKHIPNVPIPHLNKS